MHAVATTFEFDHECKVAIFFVTVKAHHKYDILLPEAEVEPRLHAVQ